MTNQLRVWKVLIALLISMTGGAIVLMLLSENPPSAGAFCLSSYYKLAPTDVAVQSKTTQSSERWKRIEIFYSSTRVGNIEWISALSGHSDPSELACHFVICNGRGGDDGEIQTTEKWQRQLSVTPEHNWGNEDETIRVCVIADKQSSHPTDYQVKRVDALVSTLARRFTIQTQSIHYPGDMTTGPIPQGVGY